MAIATLSDRGQAGRLLAQRMRRYAGREDVVVLGELPETYPWGV